MGAFRVVAAFTEPLVLEGITEVVYAISDFLGGQIGHSLIIWPFFLQYLWNFLEQFET